jgi:hypothetical protein
MDDEARRRDRKAVPPDDVIVNVLDDTWQTPKQIRLRLRAPEASAALVDALERLADVGRIDRRSLDTKARRRSGGNYVIRQYRRANDSLL